MGIEEPDELIAEALRSYSAAKPRPGLERRVLNRLAAGQPARRRFRFWAFAVGAVAAGVVALSIRPARSPVRQLPREFIAKTTADAPVRDPQIRVRRIAPSPRRKGFWAPAPLTGQEKALLMLVERVPRQAEEVLNSTEPQPLEPITIEEISIPPLEESGQ